MHPEKVRFPNNNFPLDVNEISNRSSLRFVMNLLIYVTWADEDRFLENKTINTKLNEQSEVESRRRQANLNVFNQTGEHFTSKTRLL